MRKIYQGDRITAHGVTVTVDIILCAEYSADDIDIEFLDQAGKYRHYRNWLDGGTVTHAPHQAMYRIEWFKVRDLCIKQNWYTRGTGNEYDHLLLELIPDGPADLEEVFEVAEDIFDHSNTARIMQETRFTEVEVLNMIADLIVNECSWISIM